MFRLVLVAVLLAAPAVLAGDLFDVEVFKSYEAFKETATQTAAMTKCASKGGKLADVGSPSKLEGMRAAIGQYPGGTEFWIGGKTSKSQSQMLADSDMTGSGDLCRIISSFNAGNGEKWNLYAKNCWEAKYFICEY